MIILLSEKGEEVLMSLPTSGHGRRNAATQGVHFLPFPLCYDQGLLVMNRGFILNVDTFSSALHLKTSFNEA